MPEQKKPVAQAQKKQPPAKDMLRQGTSNNHIPRQAMMDNDQVPPQEPGRVLSQDRPKVVVKHTPVPEVRIYGQTAPRKYGLGQRASDKITTWGGSWGFIGGFLVFVFIWMIINLYLATIWDPYPFILLNLVLSCIAAIQAPIILMSQNRAAGRDRIKVERDYAVNRKAEREVGLIKKDLDYIKKKLAEVSVRLK